MTGRLIAFEGLDGAGKSTVLRVVAEQLRNEGQDVLLPRLGKDPLSRPSQKIRALTRDPRNMLLSPRAELHLICAREAQMLDEHVRPALAAGKTVLLDRSLLSPIILGADGRGLPIEQCRAAAEVAAAGLWPEVTIVLDVDPRTSRIRKRLASAHEHGPPDPGRKGIAGSGFKERIGAGYRRAAKESGYPVFHTERANPEEVAARVLTHLRTGAAPDTLESPEDSIPQWDVDPSIDLNTALDRLPDALALFFSRGLIRGRARRLNLVKREPTLVAWALDADDPLRAELLATEAAHCLSGWARRPLDGPDDLRWRAAAHAPSAVARSLTHVEGPAADQLRESLESRVPGDVVASLLGRDDPFAWAVRLRLWKDADSEQRSASLVRCLDPRTWPLREKLLDKHPLYGIRSLRGLAEPRAYAWLESFADHAPKPVLRCLMGDGSEFAHRMRERLLESGREVIDSLGALDDERSLDLREQVVDRWPSTVLGSLLRVTHTRRIQGLLSEAHRRGTRDLHLRRRLAARDEWETWPAWRRRDDDEVEE